MKRIFLFFLIASLIAIPLIAFAQVKLNLNYPDFGPFNPGANQSLGATIGYVYYFIVGIAGLAAFVMLVWGGVQWLMSGAIPSQASEAKDRVRNAIIGLLLILASFLIVQVLNPELTVVNLDLLTDIDRNTLEKWVFSGVGSGNPEYRCTGWESITQESKKVLICTGTVPISPNPEACTDLGPAPEKADALAQDNTCVSRCLDNGGEYAHFGGKAYCCNLQQSGLDCYTRPFEKGDLLTLKQSTQKVAPLDIPYYLTQSVMRVGLGVYGCDDDNCRGGPDWAWRRFIADTADIANDPIFDSFPKNDTLKNQIGSLWIHGPFIAVLYEHVNYGGKRICFDGTKDKAGKTYPSPPGRLINRLDDTDEWGNRASSIRVRQVGDPEIATLCPDFEVTYLPS